MLTINPTTYQQLAAELTSDIDEKKFYTGSVALFTPEADYKFDSTLLVSFTIEECPEADYTVITDITPVWWELTTTDDEGEILNDFDFEILKRNICY